MVGQRSNTPIKSVINQSTKQQQQTDKRHMGKISSINLILNSFRYIQNIPLGLSNVWEGIGSPGEKKSVLLQQIPQTKERHKKGDWIRHIYFKHKYLSSVSGYIYHLFQDNTRYIVLYRLKDKLLVFKMIEVSGKKMVKILPIDSVWNRTINYVISHEFWYIQYNLATDYKNDSAFVQSSYLY